MLNDCGLFVHTQILTLYFIFARFVFAKDAYDLKFANDVKMFRDSFWQESIRAPMRK